MMTGTVLHVGCGREAAPEIFSACDVIRLDIDPQMEPDILGSITDMHEVRDESVDVVFASHVLEHVYQYEVVTALKEMHRVLKPGGYTMLMVPNLENVKPTHDIVYISPSGPVTGHDMYYGYGRLLEYMPYMAHHTGFTPESLGQALENAGFRIGSCRDLGDKACNLLGIGIK